MPGNSLVVQQLGFGALTAMAQVQSLVGELRYHKPCDADTHKKALYLLKLCPSERYYLIPNGKQTSPLYQRERLVYIPRLFPVQTLLKRLFETHAVDVSTHKTCRKMRKNWELSPQITHERIENYLPKPQLKDQFFEVGTVIISIPRWTCPRT